MTTATTIFTDSLTTRRTDALAGATATWRAAVEKVANGGELSAKEITGIENAADLLEIDAVLDFVRDVEALERLHATESQVALLWPTGSDKRLAEAVAELERIEKQVLPEARKRAGELKAALRVASDTRAELVRLREANNRLFG